MSEDLNDEILELLKGRLDVGRQTYGHGVGPGDYDWVQMMLEEALDAMIYGATCLLKVKHERDNR